MTGLIMKKYIMAKFVEWPSKNGASFNYDATNNKVNSFLSLFDGWRSSGQFKTSVDGNHQEVWFECFCEIRDLLRVEMFREAFKRMGVKLVFEYPYQ